MLKKLIISIGLIACSIVTQAYVEKYAMVTPPVLGGWGNPYISSPVRYHNVGNHVPLIGFGYSEQGRRVNVDISGFLFLPATQAVSENVAMAYETYLGDITGKVFIPSRFYQTLPWFHTMPFFIKAGIWGLRTNETTIRTQIEEKTSVSKTTKIPTNPSMHGYGVCIGIGTQVPVITFKRWVADISGTWHIPTVNLFKGMPKNYVKEHFFVFKLQMAYLL